MDDTPQDCVWSGENYYKMRRDGTGDVRFETVPTPTYGWMVSVTLSTDEILRLAREIERRRCG